MDKLLRSRRSPAGQDKIWHLQVLYFMNWQVTSLQRGLGLSRKACAMNVAIGYQKGQHVQERILKHEKRWIQTRTIPISQQGKNAKMFCMLEDEGTMLVVQEYIASAGSSKY
jgi:hypothetical protein